MRELVLSCFSGAGLLDEAFREQGFCVVSAGDVVWGSFYDIRNFHPPAGKFDGMIFGDPCQSHSSLANLVRAKGLQPSFPDFTPEVTRVVEEARPAWFLRENVPKAPDIKPLGYDVRTFLLDNWASLGEEQSRRRRFWFGMRDHSAPELRAFIDFALFLPAEHVQAIAGDPRAVPVAIGGSGKLKRTAVQGGHDATPGNRTTEERRRAPVTGRHEGAVGAPDRDYSTRYTLEEMLALQGLPSDFFRHSPFTVSGKRKLVGNGVPMSMGRAIARAVLAAVPSAGEVRQRSRALPRGE
jgi:DNA (cytosine-5)-methyltransferase 1